MTTKNYIKNIKRKTNKLCSMGKKEESKKGIIILSGGMDSSTLLYYLRNKGYNLTALTFNYNQTHQREIVSAKKICWDFKIPCYMLKIKLPFDSSLLGTSKIPTKDYSIETQKKTVVPNRNMIFLSYAIAYAENLGINEVFYAAHKNDSAVYPDCRKSFVIKLSQTAQLATYTKVKVKAPFIDKHKWEIVKIGLKLEVPYEKTWSCYFGDTDACGICGTCRERLKAFKKNQVEDPLKYVKE